MSTNTSRRIDRRRFLGALALASPAVLAMCGETPSGPTSTAHRIAARPSAPSGTIEPGTHDLGIEPGLRDGFLHVPASYDARVPAPLLVLMHGAGGSANSWLSSGALEALANTHGFVVLAPDSRERTWDIVVTGAFGADVTFIDTALLSVFDKCNIDPARLALGGFSDGASYALSLGAGNGDLFTHLMAFSPGFWQPAETRGSPGVYVTHGDQDNVLPVSNTRGSIVPRLRRAGYAVEYTEFAGGHTLTSDLFGAAAEWFVSPTG